MPKKNGRASAHARSDARAQAELVRPFRVDSGRNFRLASIDPGDTRKLAKADAARLLTETTARISELQDMLFAQDRWAVLLILQGMDAAGKDSVVKHVMSGVNPSGCQVYAFKAPTSEELDHDFMWRALRSLPERGRIGIFNRSYYEEVLIVRVHPELLHGQKLPPLLVSDGIWKERFEDIRSVERYLTRNGVAIRKFFLHLSKEEQRQRFLKRLRRPEKHWKFALADVKERQHWDEYQQAAEEMIRHTATPHAPWHVVPADHKWFTRLVVAQTLVETLEGLELGYPAVDKDKRAELAVVQGELERESR